MTAHRREHDDLTPETIGDALAFIDAHDRDTWVRMAQAVKSELGESGFGMWNEWSKSANNYTEKGARQVWKSVKAGGAVGIGSLIFLAQQHGFKFDNDNRQRLSDDERLARAQQREAERKQAEADERARRGAAAKLANEIWNEAAPAGDDHPYLTRKGVRAYGLRIGRWPRYSRDSGEQTGWDEGSLLIPCMDARGRITSLEGILQNGTKLYLRDGAKAGRFHIIGNPPEAGGVVAIVEGYATGASVHEATGWCVVVAFDASGLVAVAEAVREAMPGAIIVIAGDNDLWTVNGKGEPWNPGEEAGKRAAAAVNGRLVLPKFRDEGTEDFDHDQPKDWNDLHAREGKEAVRAQLALPDRAPAPAPANDNEPRAIEPLVGAVDTYTPFPDITGKGKPKDTLTNLDELLRRMGTTVRYNVISKNLELLIPGAAYSIDNQMNAAYAAIKSVAKRADFPTESLGEYLLAIGDAHQFNPVATWINSRPWDGTTRLPAFFATITPAVAHRLADGRLLRDVLMLRWLIACVAACFEPTGIAHKGVLTFVGDQNKGKTSWFKRLAPADMGAIQDGLMLNPADRDSVMQCISKWLVELGEVDATFKRADIAQLKAFISRDSDTLRRPYARAESQFARRTVFFASVNDRKFLHDETGNARWWTIEAAAINYQHDIDVQQLWAEVKACHYDGWRQRDQLAPWHLRPAENDALAMSNTDYQSINPVHEMVDKAFAWDAAREFWNVAMSATDVALASGLVRPNKADVNNAAAYARKHYQVDEKRVGKAGTKALMMPPRRGSDPMAPEGLF